MVVKNAVKGVPFFLYHFPWLPQSNMSCHVLVPEQFGCVVTIEYSYVNKSL
jgi:hypothetical protein